MSFEKGLIKNLPNDLDTLAMVKVLEKLKEDICE
jgi:hypothetical protein